MGLKSVTLFGPAGHTYTRDVSVTRRGVRQVQEGQEEPKTLKLTPKERNICLCLMQGMNNRDIAKTLGMATRTVKAHFNRMFMRAGLVGGIKRVKLAVILYRQFTEEEKQCSVIN